MANESLATKLRRTFIPDEGFLLMEADFSAIEAVLVGFFASDPEYVSLAKRGVHTFFSGHLLGNPIASNASDADFKALKREAKAAMRAGQPLYDVAKRAIHAGNYGITPSYLHKLYPDTFPTVKAAVEIQELYFGTVGRAIRPWHERLMHQAYAAKHLRSPWGDILWLWDIYKQYKHAGSGAWQWAGEDRKAGIAFLPQNGAARIMRDCLVRLGHFAVVPAHSDCRMHLSIHDSLLFSIRPGQLDQYALEITAAMTAPVSELGGLQIGVECAVGSSWGDMEEYTCKTQATEAILAPQPTAA